MMKQENFDYYMFRIIEAGREQISARRIIMDTTSNRAERTLAAARRQHYAEVADEVLDELCDEAGRHKLSGEDYDIIEAHVHSIWGCESRKARMNKMLMDTDNERIREEVAKILKATNQEETQYKENLFSFLNK